ncbi:MAG: hypothetical protein IPM75_13880 [Candidatus Competibacteraceae bacterium]|nr:hypothetical protein [Candidatus Competibacteraceae bacterium]
MMQQHLLSGLQPARALFAAEGLPFPELPPALAGQMQPFGELLFGTRDPETGPYALDVFRDAVYEQPVTDYALLGFDGHGINSWALHYYLVQGPLALFVQLPWGGAYIDPAAAKQRIGDAFALAATLTAELAVAQAARALPGGVRLVVTDSQFVEPGCAWLKAPGAPPVEFWRPPDSPLTQAVAAVQDLRAGKIKL